MNWVTARPQEEKADHDSRPIFKEGILAENFLHILTCNQQVFVGFTLGKKNADDTTQANAVEVQGKNPTQLLTVLSNYLDKPVELTQDRTVCYQIDKTKAFELFSKAVLQAAELSTEEKEGLMKHYQSRYHIGERQLRRCLAMEYREY